MKQENRKVVITAMISIAGLEAIALIMGYNGQLLTVAVGAIGALAGLAFPQPTFLKN